MLHFFELLCRWCHRNLSNFRKAWGRWLKIYKKWRNFYETNVAVKVPYKRASSTEWSCVNVKVNLLSNNRAFPSPLSLLYTRMKACFLYGSWWPIIPVHLVYLPGAISVYLVRAKGTGLFPGCMPWQAPRLYFWSTVSVTTIVSRKSA